jgi:hypothetical protein
MSRPQRPRVAVWDSLSGTGAPEGDWSRHDLGGMGLRVLPGRGLGFSRRRAGFVAMARDIDGDAGVAAVWLVHHPGSLDTAEHTLEFERGDGWRFLGGGSSSAREFSLAGRPSASVHGPTSLMRLMSSSAGRSRADREKDATGLGVAGTGWVACAGFRLATEVGHLQVGARSIPVPGHGYAIVAWRSSPALARPLIVAVGNDGSRLSELGPNDSLDSLTWKSVERALLDDPLLGPGD